MSWAENRKREIEADRAEAARVEKEEREAWLGRKMKADEFKPVKENVR